MAEYHQGKVKEISGIEMPDGPNGKTLILHFQRIKTSNAKFCQWFYWEHAAPYHYLKKVPFEKLVSSDQVRRHPLYFGPYKMDKTVPGSTNELEIHRIIGVENIILLTSTCQILLIQMFPKQSKATNLMQPVFQILNSYKSKIPRELISLAKTLSYNYLAFKVGKWDQKLGKNVENPHAKMNNPALRKAMAYAMNVNVINNRFIMA